MSDLSKRQQLNMLSKKCAELKKNYESETDPLKKKTIREEHNQKIAAFYRIKKEVEAQSQADQLGPTELRKEYEEIKTKQVVEDQDSQQHSEKVKKAQAIGANPIKNKVVVNDAISHIEYISAVEQYDGTVFAPMAAVASGTKAGKAIAELIGMLLLWIVRGFIAPVEMAFRTNIGERYYGFFSVSSMAVVYGAMYQFGPTPKWVAIVIMVFMFIRIWHVRIACFIRDRRGDYWHSYSEGVSIFDGPVDNYFATRNFTFNASPQFVEPLVLLAIGIVTGTAFVIMNFEDVKAGRIDLTTRISSTYFFSLAITCFAYQLYCFYHRRSILLDELDHELVAQTRNVARRCGLPLGFLNNRGVGFATKGDKETWGNYNNPESANE